MNNQKYNLSMETCEFETGSSVKILPQWDFEGNYQRNQTLHGITRGEAVTPGLHGVASCPLDVWQRWWACLRCLAGSIPRTGLGIETRASGRDCWEDGLCHAGQVSCTSCLRVQSRPWAQDCHSAFAKKPQVCRFKEWGVPQFLKVGDYLESV